MNLNIIANIVVQIVIIGAVTTILTHILPLKISITFIGIVLIIQIFFPSSEIDGDVVQHKHVDNDITSVTSMDIDIFIGIAENIFVI